MYDFSTVFVAKKFENIKTIIYNSKINIFRHLKYNYLIKDNDQHSWLSHLYSFQKMIKIDKRLCSMFLCFHNKVEFEWKYKHAISKSKFCFRLFLIHIDALENNDQCLCFTNVHQIMFLIEIVAVMPDVRF